MGGRVLELESERLLRIGREEGERRGKETGRAEGRAEGKQELLERIVRRQLAQGRSPEEIADICDCTVDEICEIVRKLGA